MVLILLSYYLATVQIHGNCKIINNSASHCLACASLGYSSNLKNCIYKTFHETFLGVEVLDLWNSYSCSRSFRICWKLSKHICFVQEVSLSFTFHFSTLCRTVLKVDRYKSSLYESIFEDIICNIISKGCVQKKIAEKETLVHTGGRGVK